jgi:hypothetical protein
MLSRRKKTEPFWHEHFRPNAQRASMWQQAELRRRLAKSAMVKLVAKDTGRIV